MTQILGQPCGYQVVGEKADFRPLNHTRVLARLHELPIWSRRYKTQPDVRHVGPTAQDFFEAFGGLGEDERHISTVDADGIALVAVQALGEQLEARDAKVAGVELHVLSQHRQLAELQAQMERMAKMQQALLDQFAVPVGRK